MNLRGKRREVFCYRRENNGGEIFVGKQMAGKKWRERELFQGGIFFLGGKMEPTRPPGRPARRLVGRPSGPIADLIKGKIQLGNSAIVCRHFFRADKEARGNRGHQ